MVCWIIRPFRLRNGILEHFLTLWNFEAGKSTSKLRFVWEQPILRWLCSGSKKLRLPNQLTNLWHRPDNDMVDAMIGPALKKLLNTQTRFRKSVSVEEHRAQKHDRFSRERHIAYMIHEYFSATGAHEAGQGLSTLFTINLQNNDVQDFDVRWDHAQLSVSEMPQIWSWKDCTSQNYRILYDQETARSKEPNYQQLKTAVKLHIDQMMRTRNFRVPSDVVERGSVTKSQKGKKANDERKVGEGDSCSFSHDPRAPGNSGKGQRQKGRSPSPATHSKAKTDGEGQKPSKESGSKQESSLDKSEIPSRFKFCKNPSYKFWHPPMCLNYRSETRCVHGDTCHFRHVEA